VEGKSTTSDVALQRNDARPLMKDKEFCAEYMAELFNVLRLVFWQDLPFWMKYFPNLPLWQHTIFQEHKEAIDYLRKVIITHHDNVEMRRAWVQKKLGTASIVVEVNEAIELSKRRVLEEHDYTPLPCPVTEEWRAAQQVCLASVCAQPLQH
jgi:hypothetical protein